MLRLVGNPKKFSTVSQEDIGRFSGLAADWWNEKGSMKALHSFNDVRVPWIRDTLIQQEKAINYTSPIKDLKILDVGCGAGILCEPLSRLGGCVTGLDASPDCISVAKAHSERDVSIKGRIRYLSCSAEDLAETEEGQFDALLASEVIEHVESGREFIKACVRLVKPNGFLFLTTLNKTIWSKIFGIFVAEKILKVVPDGIHDWEKFVPPADLKFMLEGEKCGVRLIHGLEYNPFRNQWRWRSSTSINYALSAVKFR